MFLTAITESTNQPPNTPSTPSGPTSGNILIFYGFSATTTDPDGDSIYYIYDWGDGTQTQTQLLSSGTNGYYAHSWMSPNSYLVKVKAVDKWGAESNWSSPATISITEPPTETNWYCYTNSNEISGLAMEWDALWVATTGGVVRWSTFDSSYVKYTTVNGLGDNIVKDTYTDADGTKWFGSLKSGIGRFTGSGPAPGISEENNHSLQIVKQFSVFPNPFKEKVNIRLQIANEGYDEYNSLRIYNVAGRLVKDFNLSTTDGSHLISILSWDGTDQSGKRVAAGIYFMQLKIGGYENIRKAILLR